MYVLVSQAIANGNSTRKLWKGALLVTSAMILIIQDDFGYPDTWPNTHDQKESG